MELLKKTLVPEWPIYAIVMAEKDIFSHSDSMKRGGNSKMP